MKNILRAKRSVCATKVRRTMKIRYSLAIFLGLCILNANTAFALAQISLTVKNPDPYTGNQSWFVYEKKTGEVIQDIASLKNFGNEPANVKISAVDATSNNSGSFILKFDEEEQKSIGAWTEIEQKEYTIQPGERIDVPFKITIPENVTPGQYIGGIVAENSGTVDNAIKLEECAENDVCNTSVSVKTRIGARIYLTVPGAIKEDIQLTDFQYGVNLSGKHFFKFRIENNGNVSYEPKAKMEIIDSMGNVYDEFEKSLGESGGNTVIEPTIMWDKKPPLFGYMTARATVTFPKRFQTQSDGLHGVSPEVVKTAQFWIMPWLAIALLMAALLSGSGYFVCAHLCWKKTIKNSGRYQVQDKEDIISIADKNHIPWKKLARLNKLKAPYILKKGDNIYIPKAKDGKSK